LIDDKAHKVSGRVAILPVELQSNFYKTISESYQNLETQLRQTGEWNLEVENMDLQAKTIDKDIISVGNPDKTSVFAGAVFMEKCQVNNLRKPYKKSEVENLIAQALTFTNVDGQVLKFKPDTKSEFLIKKFLEKSENDKKSQLEYAEDKKKIDLYFDEGGNIKAKLKPDSIVTATRWVKGGGFRGYNPLKLFLNKIFQSLFGLLYFTRLTDMTYGYRIFPNALLKQIDWKELRHPFLFETLVKPLRLGVRVSEVPTQWKARSEGESQNTFFRNFEYLRIGVKTRFASRQSLLRHDAFPPAAK
jgi:hypothetical protein